MAKARKTKYQMEREKNVKPVEITIRTRVPSKWLFVDLETMDVWRWRKGSLKRA